MRAHRIAKEQIDHICSLPGMCGTLGGFLATLEVTLKVWETLELMTTRPERYRLALAECVGSSAELGPILREVRGPMQLSLVAPVQAFGAEVWREAKSLMSQTGLGSTPDEERAREALTHVVDEWFATTPTGAYHAWLAAVLKTLRIWSLVCAVDHEEVRNIMSRRGLRPNSSLRTAPAETLPLVEAFPVDYSAAVAAARSTFARMEELLGENAE